LQVNRNISSVDFKDLIDNSEDISARKAKEVVRQFENLKKLAEESAKIKAAEDELRRQSLVTKYDSRWVE